MNKSRDGFKSPFGFTVVHAIRKNFAFPLAIFVMNLALYLNGFFGSEKMRQFMALSKADSPTATDSTSRADMLPSSDVPTAAER